MAPPKPKWQDDGPHLFEATKYSLPALKAAAKEKGIALSITIEGKRHSLNKSELIEKLVSFGQVFPAKKPKRAPTQYNKFIKKQIERLKAQGHTGKLLGKAAENWRMSNPKESKPIKKASIVKEPKPKKEPTEYHKWIKAQIKRLKEEEGMSHKQAFKKAPLNYKIAHPKQQEIFSAYQKKLLRGPSVQ